MSHQSGIINLQVLLDNTRSGDKIEYIKLLDMINYKSNPARASTSEDYAPRLTQPKDITFNANVDVNAFIKSISA